MNGRRVGFPPPSPDRVVHGRPDAVALERWLRSDDVVATDGAVRSWWSHDGTSFDYPEAAGLWLQGLAASTTPGDAEQLDRVASWLAASVAPDGSVGRGGRGYLFDAAMALSGLVAHAAVRPQCAHAPALAALNRFVLRSIADRAAVVPPDAVPAPHWSVRFGAHQLKASLALCRYADLIAVPVPNDAISRLLDVTHALGGGGRHRPFPGATDTYLHAGLYALEGLAFLNARGLAPHASASLHAGCIWLAAIQTTDGGIRAWAGDAVAHGPVRADATAQAVRVWLAVDPARWREPIERATAALAALQDERGGLRYASDSTHVNTWASLFALQALRWLDNGAAPTELV
jgi:hypothetical protein